MRLVAERSAYQRYLAFLYTPLAVATWWAAERGWIWPAERHHCPLLEHTGVACPTCGGVRSALALGRGELVGAFVQNPFVATMLVAMGIWFVAAAVTTAVPSLRRSVDVAPAEARVIRWAVFALLIGTWTYEIIRHLR